MIVAGDISLRSSGLTALDMEGNLRICEIVASKKEDLDDENLLIHNAQRVVDFIKDARKLGKIEGIVFEGLSFMSVSGDKDKLYGNLWHMRCEVRKAFPDIPMGVVPVTTWRSKALSKEEQRYWKAQGKDGLKLGVVDKLPADVKLVFEEHLVYKGMKQLKSKNPMFDLADSYFLAKYRLGLES